MSVLGLPSLTSSSSLIPSPSSSLSSWSSMPSLSWSCGVNRLDYRGFHRYHHRCLIHRECRHRHCRYLRFALGSPIADLVVGRFENLVGLADRFEFGLVAVDFGRFGCFRLDFGLLVVLVARLVLRLVVVGLVHYLLLTLLPMLPLLSILTLTALLTLLTCLTLLALLSLLSLLSLLALLTLTL